MFERIKDFLLDNIVNLLVFFAFGLGIVLSIIIFIDEKEEHCLDVYRESGYILNGCKKYEDKLLEFDRYYCKED